MSNTLRMLSLSLAAVLVLALTATTETFCQSPSDQTPSASPSATPRIRSLNQPSQPTPDLSRSLGNFSIILPPKATKEDDNANPKTTKANDTGAKSDTGAKNDTNANATPPAPSPSPNPPQNQFSQFSGRSFSRERNAPRRDSLTAVKIIDHVNGLVGGFEQGAGFGLGLEVSTASGGELKGYELYARAIASTRLYRKGEAGLRVGNDKTRGEVWFGYLRRTRDNFFNIGPLTPDINETNYAIEQRSYNGLFSHKFTSKIEGGVYARFTNTGSFKGEDNNDPR